MSNYSNSTLVYASFGHYDHQKLSMRSRSFTEHPSPAQLLAPYYTVIIPILLIICLAAFVGNMSLLACLPWIRRRAMTVNLRLSLSLAASDAWAALLILCGIIVNSYIPIVHQVELGPWTACYFLVFEMMRLAGLITSVLHLLILAINHWLSIVAPLKYKTLMTVCVYRCTIILLWITPLLIMFGYGFSLPREAFRNRYCAYAFYYRFRFRLILFLQFTCPLGIMLFIYGDILRRLSSNRLEHFSAQLELRMHNGGHLEAAQRKWDSENTIYNNDQGKKRRSVLSTTSMRKMSEKSMLGQDDSIRTDRSPFARSYSNEYSNSAVKTKALITTLLIVGTFALGWMPALFVFLLICDDCAIRRTYPPEMPVLAAQVAVNCLMMLKLLFNPFIYGFRMLDIRYALWAMRISRFGTRPLPISHVPRRFHRLLSQNHR